MPNFIINSFLMYNLTKAAIHLFMIQSFIYICVGWPGYEQLSRPQSITSRQINNNHSLSGMQEHNQLSQKKLVEMSITAAALKSLAKQQQRWTTKPKLHPSSNYPHFSALYAQYRFHYLIWDRHFFSCWISTKCTKALIEIKLQQNANKSKGAGFI